MKSLARLSLLAVFAGSLFAFSTDASASRFGGAAIHTDRVMAGSSDSYVETFTAGQAYWEVKGDGEDQRKERQAVPTLHETTDEQ